MAEAFVSRVEDVVTWYAIFAHEMRDLFLAANGAENLETLAFATSSDCESREGYLRSIKLGNLDGGEPKPTAGRVYENLLYNTLVNMWQA